MVRNKRDLGGIRTSTGMSILPGCLYRSANLHNAVPADLTGVSEVIDFRTNLEEEKMPDTLPDGITYHRVPIFTESAAGITREGNVSEVPDMVNLYRTMLTDEGCAHSSEKSCPSSFNMTLAKAQFSGIVQLGRTDVVSLLP